ncbi:MAG: MarR family transcriptional regulator [Bacteroidetes bacterium GWF2_38_335]|nr:MAG: MarR family transcriptional regulator [Bacteroidetes bacterium GWF2_38_335]OFY81091.1 MAG: MarR family transcriptional regulator [Bacteroidetes bacterium RIFOXYA12_FULL_38_20]HBS87607.1 MarR family transcriptional regulator [Bacteroidales bacterium]
MDSKAKVLDTLKKSPKPLKATEIAEKSGLDKKEVDKAMKDLKTENLIESPKVCFWQAKK